MEKKRLVHIVDDEDAIRRSASFMLKSSGFDVLAYPSGVAFLRMIGKAPEGCLLLDVRMPSMDGIEVQQALLDRGITMPVIVMTGHGDVAIAVRAMKNGAVDFIEKPFEMDVMLNAIATAFERIEQSSELERRMEAANVVIAKLTSREREVLKGLVQGLPNKLIAYELGISSRTVEVHRANLMDKLGARSLSEALRIGFAAGLAE